MTSTAKIAKRPTACVNCASTALTDPDANGLYRCQSCGDVFEVPEAETRWFDTLPFKVRLAVAACDAAGMGVDEYATDSNNPVFYEIEADFIGCPNSLGAVMGMVNDAIERACRRYGVESEHIYTIQRQVRHDALSGSYNEGLDMLMRWVGVATDDED